jgi:hypothetical protein
LRRNNSAIPNSPNSRKSLWPRTIPSGKGRKGDLSIAILLLKRGKTFLASFPAGYHQASIKSANGHCSPNLRESRISVNVCGEVVNYLVKNTLWYDQKQEMT